MRRARPARGSKSKQAVAWLVARVGRTQEEAATRFEISQAAVSQALKKYVREGMRPDARRRVIPTEKP